MRGSEGNKYLLLTVQIKTVLSDDLKRQAQEDATQGKNIDILSFIHLFWKRRFKITRVWD